MKDELSPLIEAYRAENPGTALDARAVRERVLTATWRRRRRRLRRAVWLLPIAAVLVGTGALAASAPARERVSRVLEQLGLVSPAVSSPSAPHVAGSRHARAATLAASPSSSLPATADASFEAPSVTVTAAVSPEAPSTPRPDIAPSRNASHPRPTGLDASRASAAHALGPTPSLPAPAPPRTADEPNDPPDASTASAQSGLINAKTRAASAALAADIAAYRAAHELHFARSDYARALTAWDGYLARFPRGTFTPEARLNRAVCLARLGKTTEAENILHALAASGDPYTRSRAERLLGAVPSNYTAAQLR